MALRALPNRGRFYTGCEADEIGDSPARGMFRHVVSVRHVHQTTRRDEASIKRIAGPVQPASRRPGQGRTARHTEAQPQDTAAEGAQEFPESPLPNATRLA